MSTAPIGESTNPTPRNLLNRVGQGGCKNEGGNLQKYWGLRDACALFIHKIILCRNKNKWHIDGVAGDKWAIWGKKPLWGVLWSFYWLPCLLADRGTKWQITFTQISSNLYFKFLIWMASELRRLHRLIHLLHVGWRSLFDGRGDLCAS